MADAVVGVEEGLLTPLKAYYAGQAETYAQLLRRQWHENIGPDGVAQVNDLEAMARHGLFNPDFTESELSWRQKVYNARTDPNKAREIELAHQEELRHEWLTLWKEQTDRGGLTAAQKARRDYLDGLSKEHVFEVRQSTLAT